MINIVKNADYEVDHTKNDRGFVVSDEEYRIIEKVLDLILGSYHNAIVEELEERIYGE